MTFSAGCEANGDLAAPSHSPVVDSDQPPCRINTVKMPFSTENLDREELKIILILPNKKLAVVFQGGVREVLPSIR
jgi:hypothetical protein